MLGNIDNSHSYIISIGHEMRTLYEQHRISDFTKNMKTPLKLVFVNEMHGSTVILVLFKIGKSLRP